MTERPITFPKIRTGFYRNAETGVHAFKVTGGYLPCTENRYGTSVPITDGPCATLKQARGIMAVHAGRARDKVAAAYVEAIGEWIDRAERAALVAGASTSRADAARRELQAGNLDMALMQIGLMEGFTADRIHAAARTEDAERLVEKDGADALVHFWTQDAGDELSACYVNIMTTPYTYGSPEWSEVTCKPCLSTQMTDIEADAYYSRLREEPTRVHYIEQARSEAVAEDRRRYGFTVGDLVVFADPDDTGIDTDTVWRVSAVHAVGTINAYADLTGYAHDGRSASYFDRLAPAPRCTAARSERGHEFTHVLTPALVQCGKLRTDEVHNTDRARAERVIHAARDHGGAAAGTPYGGEWPGTTVIEPKTPGHIPAEMLGSQLHAYVEALALAPAAPADVNDDAAWAGYAAALPAPSPEALAEVAVEVSTWTAQRRAAVEAFRSTARTIWSLRAEGLALPDSREYECLRAGMRHFRELIDICDRQNDALRRELARP